MRSRSGSIVKTTPHGPEQRASSPVACALFLVILAVGVTGGTLWLTTAIVNSNAEAAALIMAYG